jgi:hypothetical protein
MKEQEFGRPRQEIRQLNQSEFLSELEQARFHWIDQLEEVIKRIRNIDRQRLGADQAILDNQIVRYFREEIFDEEGNHVSSRLFFRPEPKEEIGFNKGEQ